MLFFLKNKENDKLWRELKSEVYRRGFFINIFITILFLIYLYLCVFYHFFDMPEYIFLFVAPLLFTILTQIIDYTFFQKVICKRIEKQQETIDLLMQKAGLSNPSPIIKVENKGELVETLCKYLSVDDVATRCVIAELLGDMGGTSANEALKNLLFDTDDKVRAAAQKSLEKLLVKA